MHGKTLPYKLFLITLLFIIGSSVSLMYFYYLLEPVLGTKCSDTHLHGECERARFYYTLISITYAAGLAGALAGLVLLNRIRRI